MPAYDIVKFLHILAVVFMAAPLYNLIVVNERIRFGKAHFQVDRYFENLIKGNAARCFVFQATALITGILLVALAGQSLATILTNGILLAKTAILIGLTTLLSVVHFVIQPKIEALLGQVKGDAIPPEIAGKIAPLRGKRKKLAGLCLFLVISVIILGMQVYVPYQPWVTAGLLAAAALFAWRVYKTPIPFGWF